MENFPLAFAALIGFSHAFEADHLLAVSTLVSKSRSSKQVMMNGFIWGLGHTSTIVAMGLLLIIFQFHTLKAYFDYLEIFVGIMLVVLGILRLLKQRQGDQNIHSHSHEGEAYSIGLVHGLAGSGGLILLVMADLESSTEAMSYLFLFGLGSALGMSVATSVLRLPLLQGKLVEQRRKLFTWLASLLCIFYGLYILSKYV